VDASPYPQLGGGLVGDLEGVADVDQVQRHAGDLPRVVDAVFVRDPGDHHV